MGRADPSGRTETEHHEQRKACHVKIKTFDEFQHAFQVVAAEFGQVLVEQYLEGVEHRFTVIGGRVFAITQRRPPHVVGDGRSTVSELIE